MRAALRHPPAAGRAALSAGLVATALALLLGLQPATTDIYLPALPLLARELAAPMPAAQLTMSALLLAFGLGQLVWGPMADRFGRRPVLLTGLVLYVFGSAGCALAADVHSLIFWRVLQGAAMACAVVVARAMVRDLYEPHDGARVMALGLSGLGLIALIGPPLGGWLASVGGWRAALWAVAGLGALALLFVFFMLPETLAQKNPRATHPRPLLASWRRIAAHPLFQAWTLLVTCTYGGLFMTLAASSFAFIGVLGLTPWQYGLALGSNSLAYMAGTFVCRRWVSLHGTVGAVRRGAFFTAAGGLGVAGFVAVGIHSPWTLLVPLWLYAFGHGIHQPCGQAAVAGPFPQHAGAAAALAGFVLAATAFVIGLWLGQQPLATQLEPYAYGTGFWAAATAAVAWGLLPRAVARTSA